MWSSYSYSRGNNSQATNSVVATCQLFVFAPRKQFSPSARRGMRCMWILGTGSRAPWDTRMEVLAGGHMDTVASDLTFPRDVGCRLFAQCPGAGAGAWTGLATLEGQEAGGRWHGALALTSEVMDSLPCQPSPLHADTYLPTPTNMWNKGLEAPQGVLLWLHGTVAQASFTLSWKLNRSTENISLSYTIRTLAHTRMCYLKNVCKVCESMEKRFEHNFWFKAAVRRALLGLCRHTYSV